MKGATSYEETVYIQKIHPHHPVHGPCRFPGFPLHRTPQGSRQQFMMAGLQTFHHICFFVEKTCLKNVKDIQKEKKEMTAI